METILKELSALHNSSLSYEDKLSDVCIDSLAVLDFVQEVEDKFDIFLSMKETAELNTVYDLVKLIEEKM